MDKAKCNYEKYINHKIWKIGKTLKKIINPKPLTILEDLNSLKYF